MTPSLALEISTVHARDAYELIYQHPPRPSDREEGDRLLDVAAEWDAIADNLRGPDHCYCGRPLASLPIDGTYAAETDDGVPVLALQHTCPCRGYTLSRIAPHPVVAAALAVARRAA